MCADLTKKQSDWLANYVIEKQRWMRDRDVMAFFRSVGLVR